MAKNNAHDIIDNEIDTIPRSTALTGTMTSANNKLVIGVGTLFTTELSEGDWLFDATNKEVQQVSNIVSATELVLKDAFTVALSGSTIKKSADAQYTMISYLIDALGTAEIDGNVLPASSSGAVEMQKEARNARDFSDPIIFDTTTNANKIYILTKTH